jgi:hypothetical protein
VVIGMTSVYYVLPETKGLAIEDVDVLFSIKGSAAQKRAGVIQTLDERLAQGLTQVVDDNKAGFDHVEV